MNQQKVVFKIFKFEGYFETLKWLAPKNHANNIDDNSVSYVYVYI